ncbi:T9SS type A sorting domain-containing protein [Fibrella forsythiae]|uniref:T9SS type A sorting domain-containing protein n=1 Tax=Fibrella forsythiae TaxID=2817061 RepID=A0ABS3JT68_9BACT|nr:T9SS type A sorting domain-containing protein [Fibrella forsythiae]MBO0952394.1 T9SS type A sorting domain-containing protein [Fibrella forsythiae]
MKVSKVVFVMVGLLWGQITLGQSLKLPFFDDFSTSRQIASPTRWAAGSSVYINNTLTVNHPSVNVATFDGLRLNGLPYALNDENAEGGTDTLTSLPIDLGGLTISNGVYLSFYWQRRGLGELPDATDSLSLEFLGSDRVWRKVWTQGGGVIDNNFAFQLLQVDNQVYFHPAFQFRFRSRGRQSGMFDSWHIDYVYLNRDRTATNRPLRDRAMRQPVTPLLRRYTAMPLRQFLAKPAAELVDTVRSDFTNLFTEFIPINSGFSIRDRVSGRLFQYDTLRNPINALGLSRNPLAFRPVLPTGLSDRAVLQTTFNLITKDQSSPDTPGLDLTLNDTLSATTVLDDYYAYDDGTAETVKQVNQRLARVAVKFSLNQPDAVKGVRINIAPTRRDQRGQTILLGIYGNNNGQPTDQPILQQPFSVSYAAQRNGFTEFMFAIPVNVPDTVFYVAFSQLDDPAIPVGFDRNSPFRDKLFVNLGTRWDRVTDQDGALLLRPVMNGRTVIITATEPTVAAQVFPNPTSGRLNWAGSLAGSVQLDVLDLSGRMVQTMPLSPNQTSTDLGSLPDGFYLLRFIDEQARPRTTKLIIRH